MTQLADAYNKVDIVTRYKEAMLSAQITINDSDNYVIQTEYKGNLISISFKKDKFSWSWKVVTQEPRYQKIVDYIVPYLDEAVFADKICYLFTEEFPSLRGGNWYKRNNLLSVNRNCYGFIDRNSCIEYLSLSQGNIVGRFLRIEHLGSRR